MPSTITLQQIVNFAATQVELMPLAGVGGYTSEPALSIANDTLQDLLGTPWKFNRTEMPALFLQRNRQTYQFAGACAFTLDDGKGASIDLASNNGITETGNTVTVKTLDPHQFVVGDTVYMTGNTVAAYNSTFTQDLNSSAWSGGWTVLSTPTTRSFTFTHASGSLAISGAPGVTDFGFLESASMVSASDNSPVQGVRQLQAVRMLGVSSLSFDPTKISVIQDVGTGVVRIRVDTVPGGTPWQVSLVYQAQAPVKTTLNDTWAPFPDDYAYVYRQMFLAQCYRFINSPRSEVEYQKARLAAAKAVSQDDQELSDEYIVPSCPINTSGVNQGPWWL